MKKNIAVIRGDCSSPEIVAQAIRVLDKIAEKHGHTFACLLYTSPSPRDS